MNDAIRYWVKLYFLNDALYSCAVNIKFYSKYVRVNNEFAQFNLIHREVCLGFTSVKNTWDLIRSAQFRGTFLSYVLSRRTAQ